MTKREREGERGGGARHEGFHRFNEEPNDNF